MKTCKRCERELPRSEFYRHDMMADGLLSFCKECTKARVRQHRLAHLDRIMRYDRWRRRGVSRHVVVYRPRAGYREIDPVKRVARQTLQNAVRDRRITKPTQCQDCGQGGRIHGHHSDYHRPLEVEWLCARCHGRRHWKDDSHAA